jgi:membrane-associated phospholipid phosphatase
MAERTLRMMPRRHPDDWLLLVLAGAAIVVALLFANLGSIVVSGDLADLDKAVQAFALEHRTPAIYRFFAVVAWFGTPTALVPIALIAAWFTPRHTKVLALALLLTAFISSEFVAYVKPVFGMIRPEGGRLTRESLSFPSGHVSGTTAILVIVCFISLRRRVRRVPTLVISAVVALLMGASRIVLDMHWLSDVMGGYLIGAMIGLAFSLIYEWIRLRLALRKAEARAPSPS